jgi:iron complex outermembrane receptor protein
MRGFTGSVIAILQDGIPVSTSTVVQRDTNSWHFESIEVIKGPASVLQGAGALGGIINKVTRKPSFDGTHLDGLLSYGSFNTMTTAAGLNLQLSDKVALRADASNMRSDSLYDVANNKMRSTGLTASLLFRPGSDVSVLVAVDHYNDRYNGTYQGVPLVAASAARDPSSIVTTTNGLVVDRALRAQNYNPAGSNSGADETTLRSRIDWKLGHGWSWDTDLTAYTATRSFILSDTQSWTAPSAAFPNGSFKRTLQRFYHDHQFYNVRSALANDGHVLGLRNRLSLGVSTTTPTSSRCGSRRPIRWWLPSIPGPVVGSFPTNDSAYTSGNQLYASRLDTVSVLPRMR